MPGIPPRPPVLCPGCPHRAVFHLLNKRKVPVAGDIGCYTLGLLPPLSAIHTCGCMGAGIGVAHGADKAGIGERMVAVIGDSTFFHTGMPALANVAYNRSNVLTIILDNRITGMTGHQENPGTGWTLQMARGAVPGAGAPGARPGHRARGHGARPTMSRRWTRS
jgi:indolepyruvate ferredoxin oxidoreductase, alpha subunit